MTTDESKEFQNLIKELSALKSVKADDKLKNRLNLILPTLPQNNRFFLSNFLFLRPLALAAILLLVLTGATAVVASQNTKPGDLLYPIKIAVNSLFTKQDQDEEPPAPNPTPTQTMHPNSVVPTIPVEEQQIILEFNTPSLPVQNNAPILSGPSNSVIPTVNNTIQNLPTVSITPILQVDVNLNIGGVKIGL